jgi:hypothetical protein
MTGSNVMPHLGQLPGPGWRISGCIGQVNSVPVCTAGSGVVTRDSALETLPL